MKKILVLGAGLSATSLINYLLDKANINDWELTLADYDLEMAKSKVSHSPRGKAVKFDINDEALRKQLISQADVVISMLPAMFHPMVAKECLSFRKNLFTASYISDEMKLMHPRVQSENLLFFNECGVDPGIDHMSALKVIHEIQGQGGKVTGFESSTGGLVAPQFDNNPWNYKFSWNPRNVVLAGNGTAKYLEGGRYRYISYYHLFNRARPIVIPGLGDFEIYANRDSLKYRSIYGLNDIDSMFRGTIRRAGYSSAWSAFVRMGMTDDSFEMEGLETMSWRDFVTSFLPYHPEQSIEDTFCQYNGFGKDSDEFKKFQWLGIFEEKPIGMSKGTPAQVVQHLLVPKWKLEENDLDMIVMQHRFEYQLNNKNFLKTSSMVYIGKDKLNTAMAITVGLPLAIAVEMFLTGNLKKTGVYMPIDPEVYNPILEKLKEFGIFFTEEEKEL